MKILLQIGYTEIMLPDESGVQQVLKLFSRAVRVRDRLYDGKIEIEHQELKLEMKVIPQSTQFVHLDCDNKEHPADICLKPPKRINSTPRLLLS
jgi:hypothetical protein